MKQTEIENVKKFTAALFTGNTFDSFCVTEASFATLVNITIDGHVNEAFLASDKGGEAENAEDKGKVPAVALWQQLRPLCFEAIKGNRAPLKFKIVFMTPPEKVAGFIEKQGIKMNPADVTGLFMNIRYENGSLSCISGTSTKSFSLDKSLEIAWDTSVENFIKKFA